MYLSRQISICTRSKQLRNVQPPFQVWEIRILYAKRQETPPINVDIYIRYFVKENGVPPVLRPILTMNKGFDVDGESLRHRLLPRVLER